MQITKENNTQILLTGNKSFRKRNINLKIPKDDECTVKVKYCGICSSDIYRGFFGWAYFYPLVMGHEISGEIISLGRKVKKFKVGEKVAIYPLIPCKSCEFCKSLKFHLCVRYKYYGSRNNGGYTNYVNIKEWNLIKIPKRIPLKDAVFIEPVSVMVNAYRKSEVKLKKSNVKILILGAGFLGQILLKIINIYNANKNITIFDRNTGKIKKKSKKVKYINDVKKLSDQYDVVYELTGNPDIFKESIKLCGREGMLLWIGNITGSLTLKKDIVSSILRKEIIIKGIWNSSFYKDKSDDWNFTLKTFKKGLSPSKLVTKFIKLSQTATYLKKMYMHKKKIKKFNFVKIAIKN